ncbi:MAG: DUF3772 domain-containing protein [Pseudoruegeria sp.]
MKRLTVVLIRALAVLCICQSILFAPLSAQTLIDGLPDYEAWGVASIRAEEAIENNRASDSAMLELRAELVEWRELFLDAQNTNDVRLRTLNNQISALGPIIDGETEPSDLAERRNQLSLLRAELRAPVIEANEEYYFSDSLISEIDRLLRTRQSEKFSTRGPSPLNPTVWAETARTLERLIRPILTELGAAWTNDVQRKEFTNNHPQTLILALIGLILVLRGRKWMDQLTRRVQGDNPSPAIWIAAFVVSLGQVILPFIGIAALIAAAYSTQLVGSHLDSALSSLAGVGLSFYIASWLGSKIFPKGKLSTQFLDLTPAQCTEGRFYASGLGLVYGIFILVKGMVEYRDVSDAVLSGLYFPIGVLSSLLLFRISQIIMIHARKNGQTSDNSALYNNLGYLLSRGILIAALIGPVLALMGYVSAAIGITFPIIASLGLIAFISLVLRLFQETFALAIGDKEHARQALAPILLNIIIILVSLPAFALVWGARPSDLTEAWAQFREGYSFGDVTISPTSFVLCLVVFAIGYAITKLIQSALRSTVLPRTRMDTGGQNAVAVGIGYVGLALSGLIAVTAAGIDLSGIAIVAGALSVGIGFGLQTIISNFVSGLILLVERPISEGDWIEVNGQMGYVRDIAVRATRIETFDRTDVIIPNGDLVAGVVTNWTRGNSIGRLILPVGVAYGSDTKKVEEILKAVADDHPMVVANPAPSVLFRNFGADALEFEIRAILRDVNWILQVQSDMNHDIAKRFADAGLEIPFAQRDLWLRNPEVLQTKGPSIIKEDPKQEN